MTIKDSEVEKSKAFVISEILDYIPDEVVVRTFIKKTTGQITLTSFDAGKVLVVKVSPFDAFIQIIDGKAEIITDDRSNMLNTGESIILPAHSRNTIKANVRFKMLSTIIKSGYEDIITIGVSL